MLFSIWEKESFFAECDIVIVGAGLMGLWTAFELKQRRPTLRITILEKHTIPKGASTRNAGFACFGSPSELLHDLSVMSEADMWSVVEMRYKGIRKIQQHFKADTIDFDACGGYELFTHTDPNLRVVQERMDWLNEGMQKITGVANCFTWQNQKLSAFNIKGFDALVENQLEGGLHSGKLLQVFIQKVLSSGIQILFNTSLEKWHEAYNCIELDTSEGILKTRKLILATNAFTNNFLTDQVTPGRGQIIVTSPIQQLLLKGSFHVDAGYYYFRNVGNRVLLGGARNLAFEEETTASFEISSTIQQALERFLQEHLAADYRYQIEYRWSGIMGFTASKQPLIVQPDKNVYAVTACNGMGVALSPIIAEKLAEQVLQ